MLSLTQGEINILSIQNVMLVLPLHVNWYEALHCQYNLIVSFKPLAYNTGTGNIQQLRMVKIGPAMCYHAYVVMHVKDLYFFQS